VTTVSSIVIVALGIGLGLLSSAYSPYRARRARALLGLSAAVGWWCGSVIGVIARGHQPLGPPLVIGAIVAGLYIHKRRDRRRRWRAACQAEWTD
jgi:hypothetical protein